MYSVKNDIVSLEISSDDLDLLIDALTYYKEDTFHEIKTTEEINELKDRLAGEQELRNSLRASTIFVSRKKAITIRCFLDDFYEIKKGSYWKLLDIYPNGYYIKNLADGVSTVVDGRIFDKIFKEIKRC